MTLKLRYPAVLATSVVAGVFSLIVGTLLAVDFASRGAYELFDTPQYVQLKAELAEQDQDPALEARIRQLDQQLRVAYFQHRDFTRVGVMLLLGGVIVTLATARWASALRPKMPQPSAAAEQDLDSLQQRWGRWAVAGLALLLTATLVVLTLQSPDLLSETGIATAGDAGRVTPDAAGTTQQAAGAKAKQGAAPAAEPLPSYETYLKQWPRFRGPTGSGIAATTDVPEKWDVESGEGILWKTAVPLPGYNSPIVWGDRVFLTGATESEQAVFCFDAQTGQQLWQVDVPPIAARPEEFEIPEETGHAAPTAATDGLRVYAIFASCDLVAVDFAGRTVWQKGLGVPDNPYGHATSLATWRDRLIVQVDQGTKKDDLSKLMALDGATGDVVWEVVRQVPASWASPIVVQHEDQPIIVTAANPWVIAYSAEDGSELWRADCLRADVGPSPVYQGGQVIVANESGGTSVVRAGGSGDVTESHMVWQTDIAPPDTCSPLVTDKLILLLSYGMLASFDRQGSEEPHWEEDFENEATSSPGLVGNRVYLFTVDGRGWVAEPSAEQCRRIADSNLGEPCYTSPAFQPGRMYIRGEEHLFAIGKK